MSDRRVRDILVSNVVTLHPDDSVADAVTTLLEHEVGGVPVVDADGLLVGVLSDSDLVVRQGHLHVPTIYTLFFERGDLPRPALETLAIELRKALGSTVGELMDPNPATCSEDETIEEIATRMLERGASRLPVVRDGRVVGIVARADLLQLLRGQSRPERNEGDDADSRS